MESATQSFLEVQDIREDVMILKNKSLRGILMVSSVNFALLAEEEQLAIIHGYQSFLNALDFSCQIMVHSRNINITRYLETVKGLEEKQSSELLKIQTSSYIEFIRDIVKEGLIMTKSFYVVVPYLLVEGLGVAGAATKQLNPFQLFGKKKENDGFFLSDEDFMKCKSQLWQRMEFVAVGLKRCRLDVVPLTTAEIVELLWSTHHPAEAEVGNHPNILPELLK